MAILACSILFYLAPAYGDTLGSANEADVKTRFAQTASELERERLADIVAGLDHLIQQVDKASQYGASGRIQFNYPALKRDLLSRRELIQQYINGSWDIPRDTPPLASTYNK